MFVHMQKGVWSEGLDFLKVGATAPMRPQTRNSQENILEPTRNEGPAYFKV